jgi:hypothetical protein
MNLGLTVITVPTTIVVLFHLEVISAQAAWRKLDLIRGNTSPEIIQDAVVALTALGAD